MEKFISKDQEFTEAHIEANYGKFTTNWYQALGGVKERQIGDHLIAKSYAGKCACGECLEISVESVKDNERIASYTICESCYDEEGGDEEAIEGVIYNG